jgi:hypothetical protein
MTDAEMYNIHPVYGVPKDHISCPGCGQVYGRWKRKVCSNCQECSSCCRCSKSEQKLITATKMIDIILRDG